MTKVELHKFKRPRPPGKDGKARRPREVWMLRWVAEGKRYGKTIGDCKTMSRRDAAAVRREKQSRYDCRVESPKRPKKMTLAEFRPFYLDRRRQGDAGRGHLRGFPKLAATTIAEHDMAIRYLIQHFGVDKPLNTITQSGACDFIDALEAGKLAGARQARKSHGLGQQRVRAIIRTTKSIMSWSLHFGFVSSNPFAKFDGTPLWVKPKHYVALPDFERLLKPASSGWKAHLALCRLAGLRLNEARTLPWGGNQIDSDGVEHWSGIDWDRRRICLVGTHKGKKSRRYREVPMCPRLHEILLAAYDEAEVGQETVTGLTANNLARDGHAIARRAALDVWPKFYNSLRSSCEQDWKMAGVAEPTYCTWIGHGGDVSRKHYVSPTEAEFEAVSKTHLGHTSTTAA